MNPLTMKVYSLTEFKCSFCSEWFDPYSQKFMPYLLSCGHSICSHCLKTTKHQGSLKILCPEDMTLNLYKSPLNVPLNTHIKQLLEKILGEQKSIQKDQDYLEVIKEYSKQFEKRKDELSVEINVIFSFVDKIFQQEIQRLQDILMKFKAELGRPINLINDWKESIKGYLKVLRTQKSIGEKWRMQHYLEEARKVELEISNFLKIDKDLLFQSIMRHKSSGFSEALQLEGLDVFTQQSSKPTPHKHPQKKEQTHTSRFTHTNREKQENRATGTCLDERKLNSHMNQSNSLLSNPLSQIDNLQNLQNQLKNIKKSTNPSNNNLKLQDYVNKKDRNSKNQGKENMDRLICSTKSDSEFFNLSDMNDEMLISSHPLESKENNLNIILEGIEPEHSHHKAINFNHPRQQKSAAQAPLEVVRKSYCTSEKYLKQYTDKTKLINIQQALQNTIIRQNQVELVYPIENLQFGCYLDELVIPREVQMVKMVKVGMNDEEFNLLLNFVMKHRQVHTLVVSHNRLTEQSLEMILSFNRMSDQLKNVYLSKNHINNIKAKNTLLQLKKSRINIYV